MAERKVIVELQLSDQNAVATLGKLEIETKAYQRELRLLNAEIAKNQGATKQQELRVGELNAAIRRNQSVVRELKNDLSGATAAGLRFRDKMAEASRAGLAGFGLQAVGIVGVTTAAVELVKELFTLSSEIEKTDARNRAIAGDSLPQFEAAAESTANAIGLTRREYVSLAADQALRLKQLGLEGDLVTDLSTQTVEFSEKLADFSAGELTTEQAASLLNDALTGQTKGLKALGINVKASKDEIAAQAQELMRSKGLTEEQATAVATLQLAFDATTESMSAFGAETLSIDEAQDNATAQLNEAKEALAEGLAPAFVLATQAGAGFVDMLSKVAAVQFGGARGVQAVLENFVKSANEANTSAIQKIIKEGDQERLNLLKAQAIRQFSDLAKARKEQPGNADIELGLRRLKDIILQLDAATQGAAGAQKTLVTDTEPVVTTMASLRKELKSLKDAREELDVTDTDGLKTNEASIAALEKQIAALEVSTKATQGKTKAVQELTAAQKAQNELDLAAASIQGTGKDALFKPQQDVGPDNTLGDAEIEKRTIVNEALADKYKEDVKNYNNAQDEKRMSENEALAATANIAGSLATLFDEQSVEYKAFATIQALISTYLGAAMALTDETIPSTFARIAAAAVVVFNGLANVRRIQGFYEGGYTPRRASDHEEVGSIRGMPTHANEWFAPAWQVRHPTYGPIIASLEKARKSRGMRSDRVGFFTGGTVTRGTALVNSPTAPRTTSATIATADMNRLLSSIDFAPVVRWSDWKKVDKAARMTDLMSTL